MDDKSQWGTWIQKLAIIRFKTLGDKNLRKSHAPTEFAEATDMAGTDLPDRSHHVPY